MMIGPGLPAHASFSSIPRPSCGDRFEPQDTRSLNEQVEMLRSLKEIRLVLGSGVAEADQRLELVQANLRRAAAPPRQFGPETHSQVKSYLEGGPLPASLSPADHAPLQIFKRLTDQGVQFVEPPLQVYQGDRDALGFESNANIKTMAPECAFLKLIAYQFHVPENQVQFCTLREGMLATATLRPEYLHSLDFFLEQSQAGQTFYKREKGVYEAIEWGSDFVHTYRDDPQAALVRAQPGDLVQTARALETDGYIAFRDAQPRERATATMAENSTQVVVGGVLLKKRNGARG